MSYIKWNVATKLKESKNTFQVNHSVVNRRLRNVLRRGWKSIQYQRTERNLKFESLRSHKTKISLIRVFQIWSRRNGNQSLPTYFNLSKLIQTYPNLSKPNQTLSKIYPNLLKLLSKHIKQIYKHIISYETSSGSHFNFKKSWNVKHSFDPE